MSQKNARLSPLLRAAAEEQPDVRLASLDDRAIRWAVATGLGPLLYHLTRADDRRQTSPLWPRVHSAYLTARLLGAGQQEAIVEILDACAERGCTLTLLKGIAVAHRFYPDPAVRPMRDVDVLARDADLPVIEATLRALGYVQRSDAPARFYESHHHTMPFFDPRRGVWVEVHHRLASPRRGRAVEEVLAPDHVTTNLEPMDFLGRPALRLCDELELVYIASHWASRLQLVGGAIPLLDVILLLKAVATTLRWDRIVRWLERSPATAAHLYAVLTYLAGRRLLPAASPSLDPLARRQRSFGGTTLGIVHALIDHFLLDGGAPGRILGEDRLRIVWNTLFEPGPAARKLAVLPWRILPRPPRPPA